MVLTSTVEQNLFVVLSFDVPLISQITKILQSLKTPILIFDWYYSYVIKLIIPQRIIFFYKELHFHYKIMLLGLAAKLF